MPQKQRATDEPAIRDHALIGDCHSAALVCSDATIDWCCLPRFDAGSTFAALLDGERGGACTITPAGRARWQSTRSYRAETLVLTTTLESRSAAFEVTDCFLIDEDSVGSERRQLLRVIEGVRGTVELLVRVSPRFDYGEVRPWIRRHGKNVHSATGGNDALLVRLLDEVGASEDGFSEDPTHELQCKMQLRPGDRVHLLLSYCRPESVETEVQTSPRGRELDRALQRTERWWSRWTDKLSLNGGDESGVRRSAMILKALTYAPTGAVAAAATTSLPEALGGERNWDYRYAWVRDSSFSSRALAEVGADEDADAFRAFIMRSAAGHADDLQIVYGLGGERRLAETDSEVLRGYRGSSPVRVGNGAAGQRQLDAYGELVNLTWRWHRRGHSPDDDDWRFLVSLIEHAARTWRDPDQGIWEWPGDPDHFVHSKVLCWSAIDRGIRLAEECMRQAPLRSWKRARDELRRAIERRGYDRKRGVFTQCFDRPELDASLLLLPTVEFVDWSDERMVRTTQAIREELGAGPGLLYRYTRDDGLEGKEGAFLCCSFWLAEALAGQGDLSGARETFDLALDYANDLGLFSEEVDPKTGEALGNFPQALTHLAHIDAAVALHNAARG